MFIVFNLLSLFRFMIFCFRNLRARPTLQAMFAASEDSIFSDGELLLGVAKILKLSLASMTPIQSTVFLQKSPLGKEMLQELKDDTKIIRVVTLAMILACKLGLASTTITTASRGDAHLWLVKRFFDFSDPDSAEALQIFQTLEMDLREYHAPTLSELMKRDLMPGTLQLPVVFPPMPDQSRVNFAQRFVAAIAAHLSATLRAAVAVQDAHQATHTAPMSSVIELSDQKNPPSSSAVDEASAALPKCTKQHALVFMIPTEVKQRWCDICEKAILVNTVIWHCIYRKCDYDACTTCIPELKLQVEPGSSELVPAVGSASALAPPAPVTGISTRRRARASVDPSVLLPLSSRQRKGRGKRAAYGYPPQVGVRGHPAAAYNTTSLFSSATEDSDATTAAAAAGTTASRRRKA